MIRHLKEIALVAALLPQLALCGVCSTLPASSPSVEVVRPLSVKYNKEQTEYWSTGCGKLRPECIIYPSSAAEVSQIVSALRGTNESFAVKSGGHNPNLYYSSINGGPLISTGKLNEVELDTATKTARIGPGIRWDEVAAKLDGTGYSAVGGRLGNVGVGGYMMGGGLSFMSTEYGWAANSVVAYELVLANASIVTVTRTSHPSLFKALQGGGNRFGIVTAFVVQVYPQGKVWGGNYFFNSTPSTDAALLRAVRDFTVNYPDPKAGIILTAERAVLGTVDFWTMFLYYNGPTPPPGVFDNFTAIKPFGNTCKTRTMSQLVSWNNWAVVRGSVYTIGTETVPLPTPPGSSTNAAAAAADPGLAALEDMHAHWRAVSKTVLAVPGLIASTAYQPIPRSMAALARSKGGDLLDLDEDANRIVLEYNYSFTLEADRPTVDQAIQATYGGVRERTLALIANGTLPNVYLPLFANDGYYRQDYFGRLRSESQALAREVRDAVDPEGLFRYRTDGFKI
ncbi:FAD binding domain-containing protein [Magnaporthiopsis poae ATCC 64411]|uniref:FAD binding domain-containing protein n=1 Tax=Magnaporthiopsis poae (strain ATCC 64411 / 73-15) TaxID=644358 RepID=A0A0C4DN73_MAGP6|nr:FAD binding domain-containing protein [Magnaporthiopsis poae ATCC 64411]